MAHSPTAGELAFEAFCLTHKIPHKRIPAGETPTPDYEVLLSGAIVYVEIKDIVKDENFEKTVVSRTVGSHVRAKINEAKKQLQEVAKKHATTLLLIHNSLDHSQSFGTEQHDFVSAMYGEINVSVSLTTNQISHSSFGKNKSFAAGKNTSISAVGLIQSNQEKVTVVIYENMFAKNPLNFDTMPTCIEVRRA